MRSIGYGGSARGGGASELHKPGYGPEFFKNLIC
jgi:hypothetical protein